MKPKFRKGQVCWVRGNIYDPDPDDTNLEIGLDLGLSQPCYVLKKHIRPNVTRKQLEEWCHRRLVTAYGAEELCELVGV